MALTVSVLIRQTHVELAAWQQLKDPRQSEERWRLERCSPDKKLDNAPFWMTGESTGPAESCRAIITATASMR